MTSKVVNATIEILGKIYPIRCPETEIPSLQKAAKYLNERMLEVQRSGKVINLERIAIISALNITHQFLDSDQQKKDLIGKVNHRLGQLQDKVETAINPVQQTELIYE